MKKGFILILTSLMITNTLHSDFQISSGYIEFTSRTKSKQENKYFYTLTTKKIPGKKDTLIIWTNGGPGTSSLSGFFEGSGPYKFKSEEEETLILNEYNLSNLADLLTVDQPVGTGMSFQGINDEEKGVIFNKEIQNSYEDVSQDLSDFVLKFLKLSEKVYNQIIFVGESMSGHFIPEAAVNLKKEYKGEIKVTLVSPWVKPSTQYSTYLEYAIIHSLLSDGRARDLKKYENLCIGLTKREDFTLDEVVKYCFAFTDKIVLNRFAFYDISVKGDGSKNVSPWNWEVALAFIKSGGISELINLKNYSMKDFQRTNNDVKDALLVETTKDREEMVKKCLESSIEMAVITGKLDLLSNYLGARKWISELGAYFNGKREVDLGGKIGKFEYASYENISHFEILGAGHMIGIKKSDYLEAIVGKFMENSFSKLSLEKEEVE